MGVVLFAERNVALQLQVCLDEYWHWKLGDICGLYSSTTAISS